MRIGDSHSINTRRVLLDIYMRGCPTYPDPGMRGGGPCCFYCDANMDMHEKHALKCPWIVIESIGEDEKRIELERFNQQIDVKPFGIDYDYERKRNATWDGAPEHWGGIPVSSTNPIAPAPKRGDVVDGIKIVDVE